MKAINLLLNLLIFILSYVIGYSYYDVAQSDILNVFVFFYTIFVSIALDVSSSENDYCMYFFKIK